MNVDGLLAKLLNDWKRGGVACLFAMPVLLDAIAAAHKYIKDHALDCNAPGCVCGKDDFDAAMARLVSK